MINSKDFDQLIAREDFQKEVSNFEFLTREQKKLFRSKYSLNWENFIKARTILDTLTFSEKKFSEVELEYLWDHLDSNIKKSNGKLGSHTFTSWFAKIAAILLIPLIITSLWFYFNPIEIETTASATIVSPLGARTQFTLPDGTMGWLNNGSSLEYKSNFTNQREVELIGEAYFEVIKTNNKKFVVNISDFSVEVFGTKFNVSAYEEDLESSVVLEEGKVRIKNSISGISELLDPDERFSLNKSSKTASITRVSAEDYTIWREGQLKFRNEPLGEVLKKIERWYNVDLQLTDQKLLNYRFRANFQNEPIEEILRMISMTTPISYTIEDRLINDNGTYKKKRITIKRKE